MTATDIYRPIQTTESPVLHTVVTCDLSGGFSCRAQGIVGPWARNFYVSQNAVYVWVHDGWYDEKRNADVPGVVYQLPLDGLEPGAVRVAGAPVDQFSFKESDDGHLNVLVRAEGAGDAMWAPEFTAGDVAMLRLPLSHFDRGVSTAPERAYVDLPDPGGDGWAFQNRFVGDYLLYGNGFGWGHASDVAEGKVYAHPFRSSRAPATGLSLPHAVDRIEALGEDAVVVGSDGQNLHFTSLSLGRRPEIADEFVQPEATQGELRSHGFFFKPAGPDRGVLGLPVRRGSAPGYEHLVNGSAELLYLAVDDLRFAELGALGSSPDAGQDDACVVSCVDWYGNARPIFYRDRVFALLGYELVEGRIAGGRIHETDRIDLLDARAGLQLAR